MNIKSLEQMEVIVEKNSKVLSWDGWTVVESRSSENGIMSVDGAFVNGKWIVQKRFVPGDNGWDIPKRFVG